MSELLTGYYSLADAWPGELLDVFYEHGALKEVGSWRHGSTETWLRKVGDKCHVAHMRFHPSEGIQDVEFKVCDVSEAGMSVEDVREMTDWGRPDKAEVFDVYQAVLKAIAEGETYNSPAELAKAALDF